MSVFTATFRQWAPLACLAAVFGALPAAGAAAQEAPAAFQAIPWTNDFSYLADPARRTGEPWEKFSYIPLGENPHDYLSLGGELRENYNWWDHSKLRLQPDDENHNLGQRARLWADLHLGSHFRAFLELGDNREYGARAPTALNRDHWDVQQAFVDVSFHVGDGDTLTLRPGRFMMPLGNGKLAGVRDGVDLHFTYDGLRAFWTRPDGTRLDVFYVHPTAFDLGAFDDHPNHEESFSGAYFTRPLHGWAGAHWDVYGYNLQREASLTAVSGRETRRTYGARLWGARGHWDWDAEAAIQDGHVGGDTIRAWGMLTDTGYTLSNVLFRPRLGVRVNAFSGDGNPNDHHAGTFEPMYPRMPLFSDAAWFNYMNLIDVFPGVTWHFADNNSLLSGFDFMWRQSTRDGIYWGPTLRPYDRVSTDKRFIGTNLQLLDSWQVNRFVSLQFEYTHLWAGSAVKDAGGKDSNFFNVYVDIRF